MSKRVLKPVSMRDRERAIGILRSIGRVDVDRYVAQIDVPTALASPVGPTAECLTLKDLERYVPMVSGVTTRHLPHCHACQQSLLVYRAVVDMARRASRHPNEKFAPFSLEIGEAIGLKGGPINFNVTLHSATAQEPEPTSLQFESFFSTIRCDHVKVIKGHAAEGSSYLAHCVARAPLKIMGTIGPGCEFVDPFRVSGATRSGDLFTAMDLARFLVLKGVRKDKV